MVQPGDWLVSQRDIIGSLCIAALGWAIAIAMVISAWLQPRREPPMPGEGDDLRALVRELREAEYQDDNNIHE